MNIRRPFGSRPFTAQPAALLLGLLTALAGAGSLSDVRAAEEKAAGAGGAAGRCVSLDGTLLQAVGAGWEVVKSQAEVAAGRQLMALPGQRAAVDVKDGAARLAFQGNLPELSPFPVLESVVTLHPVKDADVDFTLDRGRVALINRRQQGAVRIRVRFQNEKWDLELAPGATAAVELYARWPAGATFHKGKDRPPEDTPTVEVVLVALKGRVELKAGVHTYELRSPPGPSFFHWDNVVGQDRGPSHLDKTPAWAERPTGEGAEVKALRAALEAQRKALAERPVKEVLAAELGSEDPAARELAVYGLAATDDLHGLVEALAREKDADVRICCVEAVRNWIGRGADKETALHDLLVNERRYKPAHAEIVMHLLHGFDRAARERPETYEALIAYLRHDKLPIRELARWHLDRLVPAGRSIKYDPAGPEAEREQAYRQWKKLVPEGKVPPREPSGTRRGKG